MSLTLLDWRRRVAALYAAVRAETDAAAGHELLEGGGHFLDEEWSVVYDWLTAGATEASARAAGP